MGIRIGHARTSHAAPADQVTISNFNPGDWPGMVVYRGKSGSLWASLANLMIIACNNNNLLYSMSSKRSEIYSRGIHAAVTTYCDCSSLVRECCRESGINVGDFTTENEQSALQGTGAFDWFTFQNTLNTPLYVGDILWRRNGEHGHTAIVVEGDAPDGDWDISPDEFQWEEVDITNTEGITDDTASFQRRYMAPVIKQIPEDIVTWMKRGMLTWTEVAQAYDVYYIPTSWTGFSPFGESLTNESYAWCRFSEIMHRVCNLTKGNPGSWYGHTEDGYARLVAPELGAAMCFSQPGGPGYACIVEDIVDGNRIVTSQVVNGTFSVVERRKEYGMWKMEGYSFQGFILNPNAKMSASVESALSTFLSIAEQYGNTDKSWVEEVTGQRFGANSWTASFVVACSKRAGSSLNVIIPNTNSCSSIGKIGVLRDMGEWHDGPANGGQYSPEAGDIALFRTKERKKGTSPYIADECGIVTQGGSTFTCIQGGRNGSETAHRVQYNITSNKISGFFCPRWEQIDGTVASIRQYRNVEGLYTNGVKITDAAVRTMCYIVGDAQPSIQASGIQLAAINYTGLLANLYSVFATSSLSDSANSELVIDLWNNTVRSYYQTEVTDFVSATMPAIEDITKMSEEELLKLAEERGQEYIDEHGGIGGDIGDVDPYNREAVKMACYQFFTGQGMSPAVACGWLANIQEESQFNPADDRGDDGHAWGLCQWNDRRQKMVDFVGPDWKTDVVGQLNFIMHELSTSETRTMTALREHASGNTIQDAYNAGYYICTEYERPENKQSKGRYRGNIAKQFYSDLVG